jgi:hypothetical protein
MVLATSAALFSHLNQDPALGDPRFETKVTVSAKRALLSSVLN